jgi:hypothetical protein
MLQFDETSPVFADIVAVGHYVASSARKVIIFCDRLLVRLIRIKVFHKEAHGEREKNGSHHGIDAGPFRIVLLKKNFFMRRGSDDTNPKLDCTY